MLLNAQLFVRYLKDRNLVFDTKTDSDGDEIVRFTYKGITCTLIFTGDDGHYVSMYYQVENGVSSGKVVDVIIALNAINAKYKWVCFYLDKDNDIMAQSDAILTTSSCADTAFELMLRGFKIIEEVKPNIMRAIWN